MRGMIGVCGTPGTGKKTVAPLVARTLGLPAISLNSLVPKGEVDTAQLRKEVVKQVPPRAVLFGHLLPHALKRPEAAFVAVLRCEPLVLRKRLEQRGYDDAKVLENVEAELIGVVLSECVQAFGSAKVREYDTTTAPPAKTARMIARDAEDALASGKRASKAPPEWIDWTLRYGSSSKLRSLLAGASGPPAST